jgi:hypothetical protein
MSELSRRLTEHLRARAQRGRHMLGRRPRWSAQHAEAFVEQAKRALRGAAEDGRR